MPWEEDVGVEEWSMAIRVLEMTRTPASLCEPWISHKKESVGKGALRTQRRRGTAESLECWAQHLDCVGHASLRPSCLLSAPALGWHGCGGSPTLEHLQGGGGRCVT